MSETARGSFEVTITPEDAGDGLGRLAPAKTWSGDLTATGRGDLVALGLG
jgi:hypothetical protein